MAEPRRCINKFKRFVTKLKSFNLDTMCLSETAKYRLTKILRKAVGEAF